MDAMGCSFNFFIGFLPTSRGAQGGWNPGEALPDSVWEDWGTEQGRLGESPPRDPKQNPITSGWKAWVVILFGGLQLHRVFFVPPGSQEKQGNCWGNNGKM